MPTERRSVPTENGPAARTDTSTAPPGDAAPLSRDGLGDGAKKRDGRSRLYVPEGTLAVRERPHREATVLGLIRAGQSVTMTDATLPPERRLYRESGCDEGWYPIAPRGFVCVGGIAHATRDANDPRVVAAAATLPDATRDDTFHRGVSLGSPRYRRLPTVIEQRAQERGLDAWLASTPKAEERGEPSRKAPSPALLRYLERAPLSVVDRHELKAGSLVAWTDEFDANGRTWLVTPDLALVPKDKVRVIAAQTFRGVELRAPSELSLPLAFAWRDEATIHRKDASGGLAPTTERLARHSFAKTTTQRVRGAEGTFFLELGEGAFVPVESVALIRQADALPPGLGPKEKWIDVRVTWGALVAYEGLEPVFATACSPGLDGAGNPGLVGALGVHRISWKALASPLVGRSDGAPWSADDVPWVQFYGDNFALHGSFWQNDFGRPTSHGNLNVSPPDARRLFAWMDPPLPDGWTAVAPRAWSSAGTMIVVRP